MERLLKYIKVRMVIEMFLLLLLAGGVAFAARSSVERKYGFCTHDELEKVEYTIEGPMYTIIKHESFVIDGNERCVPLNINFWKTSDESTYRLDSDNLEIYSIRSIKFREYFGVYEKTDYGFKLDVTSNIEIEDEVELLTVVLEVEE